MHGVDAHGEQRTSAPGGPHATSSKLRVVVMIDFLAPSGGGERLAMQLAARLDPRRFERTLCVTRWSPGADRDPAVAAAVAELREAGVGLLLIDRARKIDLRAWGPLWSLMRRGRVDVLHAHKFGSNVWAALLGRAAGVPVVVTHEHTWSYEGEPVRRFLDRELIARRSDTLIAVSREDRRRMIEVEGIRSNDITFVPNGIPARPGGDGARVRAELGIDASAPVVGAVAGLRAQKAFDVLVRAAEPLRRRVPEVRVLIAGEGPERPRLEALVRELELEDVVTLLGARSDVPDVLDAVDVAVSTSTYEGSPLALMECMAAGKPVVATRVGGVPDLIQHGEQGLLVAPGDPAAVAAALAELLEAPERAAEMGRRGRERQAREFDLDVMARTLEELYERLYAGSAAGLSR